MLPLLQPLWLQQGRKLIPQPFPVTDFSYLILIYFLHIRTHTRTHFLAKALPPVWGGLRDLLWSERLHPSANPYAETYRPAPGWWGWKPWEALGHAGGVLLPGRKAPTRDPPAVSPPSTSARSRRSAGGKRAFARTRPHRLCTSDLQPPGLREASFCCLCPLIRGAWINQVQKELCALQIHTLKRYWAAGSRRGNGVCLDEVREVSARGDQRLYPERHQGSHPSLATAGGHSRKAALFKPEESPLQSQTVLAPWLRTLKPPGPREDKLVLAIVATASQATHREKDSWFVCCAKFIKPIQTHGACSFQRLQSMSE